VQRSLGRSLGTNEGGVDGPRPKWPAIGIAVLLIVGIVAYRSITALTVSARWAQHTNEVLEHLANQRSSVVSVESGYRDFALSGEDAFLQVCRDSVSVIDEGCPGPGKYTGTIDRRRILLPVARDHAKRQGAEDNLRRLDRLYAMISGITALGGPRSGSRGSIHQFLPDCSRARRIRDGVDRPRR